MGGGSETQGGTNNAGAMGIYDPNYNYGGNAFNFSAIGKGIQAGGQSYASAVAQGNAQSQSQRNYQSGSGSPWLGGSQSMSADQPVQIPAPESNHVTDFQKQYFDLVSKLYQSFQQRVTNEGFGQQGQFGM
jgi:hypothetical protein